MILDASAILAAIFAEPGHAVVADAFGVGAIACSVNLAEVATKMIREGYSPERAEAILMELPIAIHDADLALALQAARLYPNTRSHGLSLGDRLCLALALREHRQVLTADRAWSEPGKRIGVDVRLIR